MLKAWCISRFGLGFIASISFVSSLLSWMRNNLLKQRCQRLPNRLPKTGNPNLTAVICQHLRQHLQQHLRQQRQHTRQRWGLCEASEPHQPQPQSLVAGFHPQAVRRSSHLLGCRSRAPSSRLDSPETPHDKRRKSAKRPNMVKLHDNDRMTRNCYFVIILSIILVVFNSGICVVISQK